MDRRGFPRPAISNEDEKIVRLLRRKDLEKPSSPTLPKSNKHLNETNRDKKFLEPPNRSLPEKIYEEQTHWEERNKDEPAKYRNVSPKLRPFNRELPPIPDDEVPQHEKRKSAFPGVPSPLPPKPKPGINIDLPPPPAVHESSKFAPIPEPKFFKSGMQTTSSLLSTDLPLDDEEVPQYKKRNSFFPDVPSSFPPKPKPSPRVMKDLPTPPSDYWSLKLPPKPGQKMSTSSMRRKSSSSEIQEITSDEEIPQYKKTNSLFPGVPNSFKPKLKASSSIITDLPPPLPVKESTKFPPKPRPKTSTSSTRRKSSSSSSSLEIQEIISDEEVPQYRKTNPTFLGVSSRFPPKPSPSSSAMKDSQPPTPVFDAPKFPPKPGPKIFKPSMLKTSSLSSDIPPIPTKPKYYRENNNTGNNSQSDTYREYNAANTFESDWDEEDDNYGNSDSEFEEEPEYHYPVWEPEKEPDYLIVVNQQMDQHADEYGQLNLTSSGNKFSRGTDRYEEIRNAILQAENDFIAKYTAASKNSSFNKILEDSKATAMKIFGNVKEILRFHMELRLQIQKSANPSELAEAFINNGNNLRMHISDQWKLLQSENTEAIIQHHKPFCHPDFPDASQKIISVYKNQISRLCEGDKTLERNDKIQHAKSIIINVYKQMVYINVALKGIVDPIMNLADCGDVLHLGRYPMKRQRSKVKGWKKMDIFIMERYILLIKKKKQKLYFESSFPADSVQFKRKEKEQIINLYTVHEKKILLMIKFTKDKTDDFHNVALTLQYLNEN